MSKKILVPFLTATLVLSLCVVAVADTIRLKDGSVIRGQVVGFKDQQFTVLVGAGGRGRRSTLALFMEDVESIEFDSATGGTSIPPSDNSIDNGDNSAQSRVNTSNTQSRPINTTRPGTQGGSSSPPATQPSVRPNTSNPGTQSSNTRPSSQPSTQPSSQPAFFQINSKVRGDNVANGWTNTGLVVRRGQRLRITAMGQIALGNGRFSPPAGINTLSDPKKLMPNEATGALIAVIGDDNNDFILIGRTRDFVAQRDGVLFLGINEDNLSDNSGAYDAVVEAEATGSASR